MSLLRRLFHNRRNPQARFLCLADLIENAKDVFWPWYYRMPKGKKKYLIRGKNNKYKGYFTEIDD